MVVGSMIGAGIFVLPSSLAPFGWTAAAAWLVVGLGVLTVGQVIAALTIRFPQEPGILAICGDSLGLMAGRIMAWSYWVSLIGSAAVLSTVTSEYALFLLAFDAPKGTAALIGVAVLLAVAAINLSGVTSAGRFQVATTLLKLMPMVLVIGIILALAIAAPSTYTASPAEPLRADRLMSAMGVTFFTMLGFESAGMITQRVRDPERNVFRATVYGLGLVLAIYLLVSMGIVLATPPQVLAGQGAPLAAFTSAHAGGWAASALALFAAISAIGALNAVVLLMGEVPFTLVRDGQLPEWIAPQAAHGIGKRPMVACVLVTVALVVVSPFSLGAQVLDFLLRLTTSVSIFFYAGICLAALKRGVQPGLAVAGTVFCAVVLYGTGTEASLLGLALMAAGVLFHFVVGGRTRPRGTVPAE